MPDLNVVYRRLDELEPDPVNPKDHDLGAVHASIGRFGYIEPVIVDERTGRIVSGHGRTQALAQLAGLDQEPPEGIRRDDDGMWLVPVVTGWSSRSDEDAHAALVALNRTVEAGGWDTVALTELLSALADTEAGLDGTGYDTEDLDALLLDLDRALGDPAGDPDDEWAGMPDYDAEDRQSAFHCVIHFATDDDAAAFFAAIDRPKRSSFWWPEDDGHVGSDVNAEYALDPS